MYIDSIDSIWIADKNYKHCLDEQKREFIKKFAYLKNKPSNTPEGWISKELLLDNTIFHIRGGGGWMYHKESYHKECVNLINEFIDRC